MSVVDDSLDDLVAIIQWMRDTEGKSWSEIAHALGEKPGFVRHVLAERNLGTYKRIRRLRAKARVYAQKKMEWLVSV